MSKTEVCVGAVVRQGERVLLVRQSQGHSLEGQWTIPWGQVQDGESPSVAVLREIREEAGIVARLEGFLGMQELPEPWLGAIGLLFLCAHTDGTPHPDMRETDAAEYFDLAQLAAVADPVEPLCDWRVRRVLADDFTLLENSSAGPFSPAPSYL